MGSQKDKSKQDPEIKARTMAFGFGFGVWLGPKYLGLPVELAGPAGALVGYMLDDMLFAFKSYIVRLSAQNNPQNAKDVEKH